MKITHWCCMACCLEGLTGAERQAEFERLCVQVRATDIREAAKLFALENQLPLRAQFIGFEVAVAPFSVESEIVRVHVMYFLGILPMTRVFHG